MCFTLKFLKTKWSSWRISCCLVGLLCFNQSLSNRDHIISHSLILKSHLLVQTLFTPTLSILLVSVLLMSSLAVKPIQDLLFVLLYPLDVGLCPLQGLIHSQRRWAEPCSFMFCHKVFELQKRNSILECWAGTMRYLWTQNKGVPAEAQQGWKTLMWHLKLWRQTRRSPPHICKDEHYCDETFYSFPKFLLTQFYDMIRWNPPD